MKWCNHSLIAGAVAVAADAPIAGLVGVILGSVFPDRIDATLSIGSEHIFHRIHRGASHSPWLYLLPYLGIFFLHSHLPFQLGIFMIWFLIGALAHVATDMLTPGGVPYLPHSIKKKISLRLFKTGSYAEYFFAWAFAALLLGVGLYRLQVTGHHHLLALADITGQLSQVRNIFLN